MREIKYRQTDKKDLHHFQVLTLLALFSALNSIKALSIKLLQASLSEAVQNIHDFGHKMHLILLSKQHKNSGIFPHHIRKDFREEVMH